MRAITRLRVSAPTSAQLRTTLETVMTLTFRSRAMSFNRTGVVGVCAIVCGPASDTSAAETRVYQVAAHGGAGFRAFAALPNPRHKGGVTMRIYDRPPACAARSISAAAHLAADRS